MESLEDLVSYQKQLELEEDFLMKWIVKIDEQINCLQVEQMQLQNAEFESKSSRQITTKPKPEVPVDGTNEQLILSVPINMKNSLEEESDEEDEDDD